MDVRLAEDEADSAGDWQPACEDVGVEQMEASSTLKKRRLKMNKHKHRKRLKRDRRRTKR
jgi:Mitochondrial domain of unknown function (DUF1713)